MNTTFDLYIDGNFDSEGSLFEYMQSNNVGVTCGKFKNVKAYDGQIGDFLLYAYPLPDHEIRQFYIEGKECIQTGEGFPE